MTGQKVGHLIIGLPLYKDEKHVYYEATCDCGSRLRVRVDVIGKYKNHSCRSCRGKHSLNYKHGLSDTKVHVCWQKILSRCGRKRDPRYTYYGGRGIFVCKRWKKFENFFSDMGHPPSSKHSIERIDNNGPYSPNNCKWATKSEQVRNRRVTRWITFNKKRMCLKAWEEETGIDSSLIRYRLAKGWSTKDALTTRPGSRLNYRRGPTSNGLSLVPL